MIARYTSKVKAFFAYKPKCATPRSESGVKDSANVFQGMVIKEVKTKMNERIAMMVVPIINALGITFSGFLVSSAKNVVVSQPKKVSMMK